MNEIATCALVSYGVSIFRSDPLWDRKHRCPDEKSIPRYNIARTPSHSSTSARAASGTVLCQS